jgi:hypothetical protein
MIDHLSEMIISAPNDKFRSAGVWRVMAMERSTGGCGHDRFDTENIVVNGKPRLGSRGSRTVPKHVEFRRSALMCGLRQFDTATAPPAPEIPTPALHSVDCPRDIRLCFQGK